MMIGNPLPIEKTPAPNDSVKKTPTRVVAKGNLSR